MIAKTTVVSLIFSCPVYSPRVDVYKRQGQYVVLLIKLAVEKTLGAHQLDHIDDRLFLKAGVHSRAGNKVLADLKIIAAKMYPAHQEHIQVKSLRAKFRGKHFDLCAVHKVHVYGEIIHAALSGSPHAYPILLIPLAGRAKDVYKRQVHWLDYR